MAAEPTDAGAVTDAPLFDSHLHLTDARLADDVPAVLAAAREAGVAEMVTVGVNPDDARRALDLAAGAEGVWSTAGLHPHEASAFSPDVLARLEALCGEPGVVAVGETGLDYHYENSPREAQERSFRAQMELAAETGMPVVVHSRDADDDTAAMLRAFEGRVGGVLHCFTGGEALLDCALDLGWRVSFSGIATFGSYGAERVRRVPDDRILIETDSPYLAPVPRRGKRNEPAFLVHTCAAVAEMRGVAPERLARITRRNARAFYGLAPAGDVPADAPAAESAG